MVVGDGKCEEEQNSGVNCAVRSQSMGWQVNRGVSTFHRMFRGVTMILGHRCLLVDAPVDVETEVAKTELGALAFACHWTMYK